MRVDIRNVRDPYEAAAVMAAVMAVMEQQDAAAAVPPPQRRPSPWAQPSHIGDDWAGGSWSGLDGPPVEPAD